MVKKHNTKSRGGFCRMVLEECRLWCNCYPRILLLFSYLIVMTKQYHCVDNSFVFAGLTRNST